MSSGNGSDIIRVGSRGRRVFQYDDDTKKVTLDVIHVSNLWADIDRTFRNEKNEIPAERVSEHMDRAVEFAAQLLEVPPDRISKADALHFLKLLTDEGDALKPFFEPKSADERSSQESTAVTFST